MVKIVVATFAAALLGVAWMWWRDRDAPAPPATACQTCYEVIVTHPRTGIALHADTRSATCRPYFTRMHREWLDGIREANRDAFARDLAAYRPAERARWVEHDWRRGSGRVKPVAFGVVGAVLMLAVALLQAIPL